MFRTLEDLLAVFPSNALAPDVHWRMYDRTYFELLEECGSEVAITYGDLFWLV